MPITGKQLLKGVPLSNVILRPDNPRMNQQNVLNIAKSILRFGYYKDSVGVDESMECWFGDTTTKALLLINDEEAFFTALGENEADRYKELRDKFLAEHAGVVPEVTQISGLTEEEKFELRIADNKGQEGSDWHIPMLTKQIEMLNERGRVLADTCMLPHEVNRILQISMSNLPKPSSEQAQNSMPPTANLEAPKRVCKKPDDIPDYEDDGSTSEDQSVIYENQDAVAQQRDEDSAPYVVHIAFSTKAAAEGFLSEIGFPQTKFDKNRRIVTVDLAEKGKNLEEKDDGESN